MRYNKWSILFEMQEQPFIAEGDQRMKPAHFVHVHYLRPFADASLRNGEKKKKEGAQPKVVPTLPSQVFQAADRSSAGTTSKDDALVSVVLCVVTLA